MTEKNDGRRVKGREGSIKVNILNINTLGIDNNIDLLILF
jgi:hypothetical protein